MLDIEVQRYDPRIFTMIRSTTGYGKAEGVVGNRKYNIEVRSLNSRQFDLNTRIPSMFREKEMELESCFALELSEASATFFCSTNLMKQ